ncbi:MAG: dienelactone hydrolase family protein [Dehalococcoidia bacterium]
MNEYQRYLVQEFADEYNEGHMSRRQLLRRAVLIMGSVPAGMAALAAVGCGGDDDDEAADAANTPEPPDEASSTTTTAPTPAPTGTNDTVQTSDVNFRGPGSDLLGYLAKPPGSGPYPGIVVIHENRGLNDHIKDVTRRYANEGFIALAVDLASRAGGSKPDASANTGVLGSANIADLIADMKAYVEHLKGTDGVKTGGVGVTGFCFGGGYTWDTVVEASDVKAAAPYYGTCRQVDRLKTTKTAVLAIYGGNDTRITGEADKVRAALQESGAPFDIQVYQGANHAFFNDTGSNYNEAAAKDAWSRTLAWFRQYV